jgi:hypothetical protein
MTKILSFSLRSNSLILQPVSWLTTVLAATGLVLMPFGDVHDLVREQNPWHGFESKDPILWIVRIQEMKSESCEKWTQALSACIPGTPLASSKSDAAWQGAWKTWEPWQSDDLDDIKDCHDFPCDVKLNRFETSQMKALPEEKRFKKFLDLIVRRSLDYEVTQKRKEYEFPGDPADPWALFQKKGFVSSLTRPAGSKFSIRKLDFAPGKIRTIRQVLDRRFVRDSSGLEAVRWVRDAYIDHYFDGWGEWTQISCQNKAEKKNVLVVQALVLEVDLLKKTDLVSKMMRGKLKSAIETNGYLYLDAEFLKIKKEITGSNSSKRESNRSLSSNGVAGP